ncbi:MAG: GDP-mannose 4,6-dehydratase [candidate division WOR-3 bacterium]|nr:MAG: GDP-mannose 4,6-dehydratase [candidate division WOR-3 bacterium]
MKTILATGSEGFVGSYLIEALEEDYEVVPTSHPLLLPSKETHIPLDIINAEMTQEVLKTHNPDIVFHLAALSSVSKSLRDRPLTYSTNITGTVNLLEAARLLNKRVRFVFVSTCEVYGDGGDKIRETNNITLKSPYAVSKYAAELICQDYQADIDCVILRPFNHTGPGQAEHFVMPTIAKQIAEIEKGKRPPLIELGNIEVEREFMNVQDVINAYTLAIEKCKPEEIYNISSNKGHSVAAALAIFKKLSKKDFEIKIDPSKIRKDDIDLLIGNGRKFSRLTKWKPKTPFTKTIEDILNYWRAKI